MLQDSFRAERRKHSISSRWKREGRGKQRQPRRRRRRHRFEFLAAQSRSPPPPPPPLNAGNFARANRPSCDRGWLLSANLEDGPAEIALFRRGLADVSIASANNTRSEPRRSGFLAKIMPTCRIYRKKADRELDAAYLRAQGQPLLKARALLVVIAHV